MAHSPVIRCGPAERSHDDIRLRAARLAGALADMGLKPGDRYAILMRNDVPFVEATLAGAAIGAVPVPVNWHWNGVELAYLLNDSDSKLVFAHTSLLPTLEPILPNGMQVVEVAEPDYLAEIYGLSAARPTGRYPDIEALIRGREPLTHSIAEPPLGVIYTSGTTGLPKGIMRQPMSAQDVSELSPLIFAVLGLSPGMSTVVTAPLYHTAPNAQMVFAVALGCDVEILPKFDAEGLLRLIEGRRIEQIGRAHV